MGKIKDLSNKRFERLLVTAYAYSRNKRVFWECLCDCGNAVVVCGSDLKAGKTQSCGCLHKEIVVKQQTKHGLASRSSRNNQLYSAWKNMKGRCLNSNRPGWENYGGRGIKVCDRWLKSFENFAIDMGDCPGIGYSLERVDNNGDYKPENCRWATRTEQSRNTRTTKLITYQGETLPISTWAERLELKVNTIMSRLRYGWSVEKALTEPARAHKDYSSKKTHLFGEQA